MTQARKAVVPGGCGLIGSACMRALARDGFAVTGIGRSWRSAQTSDESGRWVIRDIAAILPDEWRSILRDAEVVVNAAGALQDGAADDLEAIHMRAVERLVAGCAGVPLRIVQISAAGVSAQASTAFFRTKAKGDDLLRFGMQNFVILRPTLVLSPEAYGGTALLRAVAACPVILPVVFPEAQVQTVHVDDVADAAVAAARGEIPSGTIADLTEAGMNRFGGLADQMRLWLGLPAPLWRPVVPTVVVSGLGRVADVLGHPGWRSPLRTAALKVLREGIIGDPDPWQRADGRPCKGRKETLAQRPATRQEWLFARVYVGLPVAIGTLAIFRCLSGLIAVANPSRAVSVVADRGRGPWLSWSTVIGGAVADIFPGLAILWRPWTKHAAPGMLGLSAVYPAASLAVAPDLWADPLGPMVKVLPAMALAALVFLLTEDR